MRILFLVTRADAIGGAQIHVRDLAEALHLRGHQVLVVTGAGRPYLELLRQRSLPHTQLTGLVRPLRPCYDLQALAALIGLLRRFRPDLVSTHSSKAGILGRLAAALTGIPCLFTCHGWSFAVPGLQGWVYYVLERFCAPLARRIICVAEPVRQAGLRAGIAPHRLVTIPNAMPDILPQGLARPADGLPVRIVMVGRLEAQKAQDQLVGAVAGLPTVHLDLVGDGPREAELRALVAERGLTERVTFWGYRRDVARLLAQAHIFALISHWEAFPRSTLEAMRAGLPVVVSDVGGAADAVVEGVTGYVIPPGRSDILEARLRTLAASPQHRAALGAAGRRRYERHYRLDRMVEQTLQLYRDVLQLRG